MKKQKHIFYVASLLLLIFVGISAFTFYKSNKLIAEGYLASEGSAAKNFAVLTASNIHLTDAQAEALKGYSYEELLASEENEHLRTMMANENLASEVDYAYVMVRLKPDEVKYYVTEENKDRYDAPVGTPLEIMWLLDVTVNDEAASPSMDELERYSYYIDEDTYILGSQPSYNYNSSEWGDHICGYAPLYSTSGTYIGAVGVELRTSDFETYRTRAMAALGILLAILTITLLALFLFLYISSQKLQYEKIYTDPLTGLSNRSYYNDQFIKYLGTRRTSGHCFALLVADIDWFKKVNDTFGHETGDEVLIELSEILLKLFGKRYAIRFGGEEFLLGFYTKDEATLEYRIQELFETIKNHLFSKHRIDISISLGGCYVTEGSATGWLLSDMFKTADAMLYEAKRGGRCQYKIVEYKKEESEA